MTDEIVTDAIPRSIVGFEPDRDDNSWIVALDCGHRRHLRHRPPLSVCAWIDDEAARRSKLGHAIECTRCWNFERPGDLQIYKTTATYTSDTVPAGLLRDHSTKNGVWGRLIVDAGALVLKFSAPRSCSCKISPGREGTIPPAIPHCVKFTGSVRFRIEFLR